MDVRHIYQEAQSDLARYQAQLTTIQQKVAGLTKVVEGLRVLDPDLGRDAVIGSSDVVRGGELRHAADSGPVESRLNILSVIRTANTFMSTQEILDAMILAGFIEDDREAAEAVRKVISRMATARQLVRERRDGRSYNYGLPGMAPQNAESPTVNAVGLSVPTPAIKGGGEASGTESSRDHVEGSSWQAIRRVHDHGAPVMTSS